MYTKPHKNSKSDNFTAYADTLNDWMQANGYGPPPDIETRKLHVTFFPSKYALSLKREELTLPELAERIRTKTAREKIKLPWLKLARFGDKKTDADCVRFDENILTISGCESDYDTGTISFDTAIDVMRKVGIRVILYTSASHTPLQKERWRLVVPFSKEYCDRYGASFT